MDRKVIQEKLSENILSDNQLATLKQKETIIDNLIESSIPIDAERGTRNLIIGMEELSELQKEISKAIRGKLDRIGLIEEIIDVGHTIDVLKNIFQISNQELERVRYIKLEQIKAKCKDNNFM